MVLYISRCTLLFSYKSIFEIHPCWYLWIQFIHFCSWTVFHSLLEGQLGHSHLFAVLSSATGNIRKHCSWGMNLSRRSLIDNSLGTEAQRPLQVQAALPGPNSVIVGVLLNFLCLSFHFSKTRVTTAPPSREQKWEERVLHKPNTRLRQRWLLGENLGSGSEHLWLY